LILEIAPLILAGLYLLMMLALFFATLSGKKSHSPTKQEGEKPLVTVIVLVSRLEDLSSENIVAIFNQEYPAEKIEYLILDQTGNFLNLRSSHESFYQTHYLPLYIKSFNWGVITEIIEFKTHGEIIVFLQGRSKVSKNWIDGLVNSFHPDGSAIILPKLVSEEKSDKYWFQAEQSLFMTVLSIAFAKWRVFYSVKLNNIAFWRKDILEKGTHYLSWLIKLRKKTPLVIYSDGIETAASFCPLEKWRDFLREYTSQLKLTNSLLSHSFVGTLFIIMRFLMILTPAAYFLLFLLKAVPFYPMIVLFFAKFIGEGLIISRGARLYQRQDLLHPFWSWFFTAPIVYGLAFFRSLFQRKRIKSF